MFFTDDPWNGASYQPDTEHSSSGWNRHTDGDVNPACVTHLDTVSYDSQEVISTAGVVEGSHCVTQHNNISHKFSECCIRT